MTTEFKKDEFKVIWVHGHEVVHTDSADYLIHEGHAYSVNGGYFMKPRTTDWCRWEVDESLLSPMNRERGVAQYYKDKGICLKRLCHEIHEEV